MQSYKVQQIMYSVHHLYWLHYHFCHQAWHSVCFSLYLSALGRLFLPLSPHGIPCRSPSPGMTVTPRNTALRLVHPLPTTQAPGWWTLYCIVMYLDVYMAIFTVPSGTTCPKLNFPHAWQRLFSKPDCAAEILRNFLFCVHSGPDRHVILSHATIIYFYWIFFFLSWLLFAWVIYKQMWCQHRSFECSNRVSVCVCMFSCWHHWVIYLLSLISSHTRPYHNRSGLAQMDEIEGLRLKPYPEDSVSLASSVSEPINLEGQSVTVCWNEELLKAPRAFVTTAWSHYKNSFCQLSCTEV